MTLGTRAIFIDTSAFFALVNDRDASHAAAMSMMRALAQERRQSYSTNFILAETHALVLSRLGPARALAAVDAIKGSRTSIERISEEDEMRAHDILRRYTDMSFSYTDATSFAVFERLRLSAAFTFDRDFQQYGLPVFSPS